MQTLTSNRVRSIYARPDGGWCAGCLAKGFHLRMTDPKHFELHIPRDRWPESMRPAHKERVVVAGKVYTKGEEPGGTVVVTNRVVVREYDSTKAVDSFVTDLANKMPVSCDCGYVASGAKALAMHQRMAKVHKEPVSA